MAEQLEQTVTEVTAVPVASLGATDVIAADGPQMTRGGTIISSTIAASFIGGVSGEAPILWGIARGDLTAAEIEEYLEIQGPLTPSDKVGTERASRGSAVRALGVLEPFARSAVSQIPGSFHKNMRIRLTFSEEELGWQWWAHNMSNTAFSAGSQTLRVVAQHFVKFNKSG